MDRRMSVSPEREKPALAIDLPSISHQYLTSSSSVPRRLLKTLVRPQREVLSNVETYVHDATLVTFLLYSF